MTTKEQAYAALVAMTQRCAGDKANTASWVVKTSQYTSQYLTVHTEFKRDKDLVQPARTFIPTDI